MTVVCCFDVERQKFSAVQLKYLLTSVLIAFCNEIVLILLCFSTIRLYNAILGTYL